MITAIRRILCSASEDIGMAYPMAVPIVKACVDNALQLGLPEAKLPLAQAVILLATAPKSNSACMAIDAALSDVRAGRTGGITLAAVFRRLFCHILTIIHKVLDIRPASDQDYIGNTASVTKILANQGSIQVAQQGKDRLDPFVRERCFPILNLSP